MALAKAVRSACRAGTAEHVNLDVSRVDIADVGRFFPGHLGVSLCTKNAGGVVGNQGGKGLAVTVIGESKKGKESSETLSQLKAYKAICDELLPAMRNGSHLHNLIFRFAGNCTLVLHRKEDPNQVIGGCTFRFIKTDSRHIVLDVLLMVVAQRPEICGQGHGTRIVNFLKHLTKRQTRRSDCGCLVATQADIGPSAIQFWQKQGLVRGTLANELIGGLHRLDPTRNHVYESSFPMVCLLTHATDFVEPGHSARAKRGQHFAADCACNGAVDDDKLVTCAYCGGRHHYVCVQDAIVQASVDGENGTFVCNECTMASAETQQQPRSRSAAAALRGSSSPETPTDAVEEDGTAAAAIFKCTFPGCNRTFEKQRGRAIHFAKTHGNCRSSTESGHLPAGVMVIDTDSETDIENENDAHTVLIEQRTPPAAAAVAANADSTCEHAGAVTTNTPATATKPATLQPPAASSSGVARSADSVDMERNEGADNGHRAAPEAKDHIGIVSESKRRRLSAPGVTIHLHTDSSAPAPPAADIPKGAAGVSPFEQALALVWRMHDASDLDMDSVSLDTKRIAQPASETVLREELLPWGVSPPEHVLHLLDSNVLGALKRWLAPTHNCPLPDHEFRSGILKLLLSFSNHVTLKHIQRSGGLLGVLRRYSSSGAETAGNKARVDALISNWTALMFSTTKRIELPRPQGKKDDRSEKQTLPSRSHASNNSGCQSHVASACLPTMKDDRSQSPDVIRILPGNRSQHSHSSNRYKQEYPAANNYIYTGSQRREPNYGQERWGDDRRSRDGNTREEVQRSNRQSGSTGWDTRKDAWGKQGRDTRVETENRWQNRDAFSRRSTGIPNREPQPPLPSQWSAVRPVHVSPTMGTSSYLNKTLGPSAAATTTLHEHRVAGAGAGAGAGANLVGQTFAGSAAILPSNHKGSLAVPKVARVTDARRMPLTFESYEQLVASKSAIKRMTTATIDRTLNCKRIIAEMVKILIKPIYESNRIDKGTFKYISRSVTKDVAQVIRNSPNYDYQQVPFPPSRLLFVEVTKAIHKALGHP